VIAVSVVIADSVAPVEQKATRETREIALKVIADSAGIALTVDGAVIVDSADLVVEVVTVDIAAEVDIAAAVDIADLSVGELMHILFQKLEILRCLGCS
jgi:hypothetical protein